MIISQRRLTLETVSTKRFCLQQSIQKEICVMFKLYLLLTCGEAIRVSLRVRVRVRVRYCWPVVRPLRSFLGHHMRSRADKNMIPAKSITGLLWLGFGFGNNKSCVGGVGDTYGGMLTLPRLEDPILEKPGCLECFQCFKYRVWNRKNKSNFSLKS